MNHNKCTCANLQEYVEYRKILDDYEKFGIKLLDDSWLYDDNCEGIAVKSNINTDSAVYKTVDYIGKDYKIHKSRDADVWKKLINLNITCGSYGYSIKIINDNWFKAGNDNYLEDISIKLFKSLKHKMDLNNPKDIQRLCKAVDTLCTVKGGRHIRTPIDRLFTVKKLEIGKDKDSKGFEYIKVYVSCISDITVEKVKKHKKELDAKVLSYIENNKQFQKYNIPINFLKLSNLVLTHDKILEYTFELKVR